MDQGQGSVAQTGLATVILAVLIGAVSCNPLERDCSQSGVVCIGLVTGYGGVKTGIEKQAWLALQDSRAAGLVNRIDYIETIDTRDRAANIAYFLDSSYDIVIATGDGILDEMAAAAIQHPDVLFVVIQPRHDSPAASPNLVPLEFPEEQGGFLAGSTAALLTRTHRVAAVCEARFIDYVERYCEGFAAGVRFISPQVTAEVAYRNSTDESLFQDTAWGATTAAQMVDRGADIVFAVGEETAAAALQEAARRGSLVIGAQADMSEELPEIRRRVVTSAILNVRESLAAIIRAQLHRQLEPGPYPGSVGLAPFQTAEGWLTPSISERLLSLEADLRNGRLNPRVPMEAH